MKVGFFGSLGPPTSSSSPSEEGRRFNGLRAPRPHDKVSGRGSNMGRYRSRFDMSFRRMTV
ncbi:hypothetical protein N7536_007723 [Penicillium majusculum]|nr:hypothetical protein N7536_007723 [Penicillium majusculum]